MSEASIKPLITLRNRSDWDAWLQVQLVYARTHNVIDHIDPKRTPEEAAFPQKPTLPEPSEDEQSSELKFRIYEAKLKRADTQLREWQAKQKAYNQLMIDMHKTIDASLLPSIEMATNAHDVLSTLKKQFAPSDRAAQQELMIKHQQLRSLNARQNLDVWIRDWENFYRKASQIGLVEVQNDRPSYDFLQALSSRHLGISNYWISELEKNKVLKMNNLSFYELLETVRNLIRVESTVPGNTSSRSTQGTFSTFQGEEVKLANNSNNYSNRKRPCICGDSHSWRQCCYLNEAIRPTNWKSDPAIKKQVDRKLEIPKTKQAVERAQQKWKSQRDSTQSTQEASTTQIPRNNSNFTTEPRLQSTFATLDNQDAILHQSFILDSGSDVHTCNSRSRFTNYREAATLRWVNVGDTRTPVKGEGDVIITLHSPQGPHQAKLTKVAFIPNHHTNIVAGGILEDHGVHHDSLNQRMQNHDGTTFCNLKRYGKLTLIEYDQPQASYATQTSWERHPNEADAITWHRRLGHCSADAIRHLEEACLGVKIRGTIPSNFDHCEPCRLSKAKRQILRAPRLRPTHPFQRVNLDLSHYSKAYNGAQYLFHAECDLTGKGEGRCLTLKTAVPDAMRDLEAKVNRQYQIKLQAARTDGETAINRELKADWQHQGISLEYSPPRTQALNGASERAGGVIASNARSMRIDANLPESLWPESTMAAIYLRDHTPKRSLNWVTPITAVHDLNTSHPRTNRLPWCGHLKVYGCKAYALRDPDSYGKSHKQAERAEIGYLVGYASSSTYHIWLPQHDRVIVTRDVTFDETEFYTPDQQPARLTEAALQRLEGATFQNIRDDDEESIRSNINVRPLRAPASAEDDASTPTINEPSDHDAEPSEKAYQAPQVPTPRETPEADIDVIPSIDVVPSIEPATTRHRDEGIDITHIIKGPRHRKPTSDRSNFTSLHQSYSFATYARRPLHRSQLPLPPEHWHELKSHAHGEGFREAARLEFKILEQRGTFKKAELPTTAQVIPTRWVFTYKFDQNGHLARYKARLVVRGDLQANTHEDFYAATLAAKVFRFFIAIIAAYDLETAQFDAVNAFVNSLLRDVIYVKYPPGFGEKGYCLLLLRALYGLRQSPMLWQETQGNALKKLGFKQSSEEPCVFYNDIMIIFIYVDDMVTIYRKQSYVQFATFRDQLSQQFEMKQLGELQWFLGVRVIRDRQQRKIWLLQDAYIEKIVQKYGHSSRHAKTPLPTYPLERSNDQASTSQIKYYQGLIGHLQYPAVITRPDIAMSTSQLAEHLQNPSPRHLQAAEHLLKYLSDTSTLALEQGPPIELQPHLQAFSDAAFADTEARRSSDGYVITLFGSVIDWRARKQKVVTTSTTEAELYGLQEVVKELYKWRRFFNEIGFKLDQHEQEIYCDNLQTVRLITSTTPKLTTKLKHVDITNMWLKQEINAGNIDIDWVNTNDMLADGLTKPLPAVKHAEFLRQLNMIDTKSIQTS